MNLLMLDEETIRNVESSKSMVKTNYDIISEKQKGRMVVNWQ